MGGVSGGDRRRPWQPGRGAGRALPERRPRAAPDRAGADAQAPVFLDRRRAGHDPGAAGRDAEDAQGGAGKGAGLIARCGNGLRGSGRSGTGMERVWNPYV